VDPVKNPVVSSTLKVQYALAEPPTVAEVTELLIATKAIAVAEARIIFEKEVLNSSQSAFVPLMGFWRMVVATTAFSA
jgi:hypothetical protein